MLFSSLAVAAIGGMLHGAMAISADAALNSGPQAFGTGSFGKDARYPEIQSWEWPNHIDCTLVSVFHNVHKSRRFWESNLFREIQNKQSHIDCDFLPKDHTVKDCFLLIWPERQQGDPARGWRSLHVHYRVKHLPAAKTGPASVGMKFVRGFAFDDVSLS